MVKRARQQGCCSSSEGSPNFDARAELGRRRLVLLRRVSAVSSALLCVAALVLLLPGVPVGPEMADRIAWAAAVWGLPRLLGYARAALSVRRVTLPLLAGTALLAIAVAGLPVVTAVVVATVLVSDLTRRSSAAASDSIMIDAGHAQRV